MPSDPGTIVMNNFETILEDLEAVVEAADINSRHQLLKRLEKFVQEKTTVQQQLKAILFSSTQLPLAVIACDLGIFSILARNQEPMLAAALSIPTGSDLALLSKVLRYAASTGMVDEVGHEQYSANALIYFLASRGGSSALYHFFGVHHGPVGALPSFLKSTSYQAVTDSNACAFQVAHKTPLSGSAWLQANAKQLKYFNNTMETWRIGMPAWLDSPGLERRMQEVWSIIGDGDQKRRAAFVDIAGNVGHQCELVLKRYPKLAGKIIVQDLPDVIAQKSQKEGIVAMVQDMFRKQQVRGALVYYLRHTLHDWPDDKALEILQNTKEAMKEDSVILIDEIVVANRSPSWQVTALEMLLMATNGASERTWTEWTDLILEAGLSINGVWHYDSESGHAIIECGI